MLTWEEWLAALKKHVDSHKILISWIKNGADTSKTLATVGKDIKDWIDRNPAPPNPRVKPKPPSGSAGAVRKAGTGAVDITKLQHNYQNFNQAGHAADNVRVVRRIRRGEQGATSLGMLVALGGAPVIAIGAVVVKYVIEEVLWDVGEQVAGGLYTAAMQALTPGTQQEAEAQYNAYVWNIKGHWSRFGPNVIPILSKEEWLWREFGVRWDVLQ